jgi:hypothetical protein
MILQINAERGDSAMQAITTAMYVSRALQMKIVFYWNRVAIYVCPNDTLAQITGMVEKTETK